MSRSRTSLFCTSVLTGKPFLQHHLKMFIYIILPLCDLNNSSGVCDVWVNWWYESTRDVLFNHKWNKWVSTITSLWLDLFLRVYQPHLCLLYVWVQKQVTEIARQITWTEPEPASGGGGKVPWEKFSQSTDLPEKRKTRVILSERHEFIWLAKMQSIKDHLC